MQNLPACLTDHNMSGFFGRGFRFFVKGGFLFFWSGISIAHGLVSVSIEQKIVGARPDLFSKNSGSPNPSADGLPPLFIISVAWKNLFAFK